jgi:hypothetical protein
MKARVKLLKYTGAILVCVFCINAIKAQSNGRKIKIFQKSSIPIVSNSKEDYDSPYRTMKLDYHNFKMQGEDTWSATKGDWYLKYKKMFDFRCKEPFIGGAVKYTRNDYRKIGYLFRLVDNQTVEDSIRFLLDKYPINNADTLKYWGLPPNIWSLDMGKLIKRLGQKHFKFVITVFDSKKNSYFIDVPEAEQANDEMVRMRVFKYPADVDILLYNFKIDNWEYVETVTVSGDHELERYVLQKFEPRYLKDCELKK